MGKRINIFVIAVFIMVSIMWSNFVCAATWYSMESGTTNNLNGVWCNSSSDVFAVGNSGTILHYNGGSWSAMASGTTNDLYKIWGNSNNNIYAVGDNGLILHYDGSNWTSMTSGTSNLLYCIWGSASDDIYAGGYSGTLLHYNGIIWEPVDLGVSLTIESISGSSANNIFLVGRFSGYIGTEILHYDGTTWSIYNGPPIMIKHDIWVSSGMDIFIVGNFESPTAIDPYIGHYNGTGWDTNYLDGSSIQAIWGRSYNDVFTATDSYIFHYDGSIWSKTDIRAINAGVPLDIWGTSGIDVFAVGGGGTILRYGEPTLIILSSFTALPFNKKISVGWNTESETDNAGFNIYRSEKENGEYVKINASLISAKGSSIQGASYEFTDTNVQNRKTYYYKLEDIDTNGISTFHGPVKATPRWIYGVGE